MAETIPQEPVSLAEIRPRGCRNAQRSEFRIVELKDLLSCSPQKVFTNLSLPNRSYVLVKIEEIYPFLLLYNIKQYIL